jgi:hypothetical protein
MSRFVQSLEPRTLFSATPITKETLLADRAAIIAQAKAAKASLAALNKALAADTKTVQTDSKGSKANAPLLKTLKADEAKTRATVNKDLNALLGPTQGLANRSIGHGIALMAHSNPALDAKIAADVAALAAATAVPLAKLEADLQAAAIGADVNALLTANLTDATLAADITKLESDVSAAVANLTTAATTFQSGVGTVATDVASAPPSSNGSGGTTIPTITGTYSGSSTETSGDHIGGVSALTIIISSESNAGALTGSATVVENSGTTNPFDLVGTVAADGTFTATFNEAGTQTVGATISGHVSGNTITGSYQSTDGSSGTFSVSKS